MEVGEEFAKEDANPGPVGGKRKGPRHEPEEEGGQPARKKAKPAVTKFGPP